MLMTNARLLRLLSLLVHLVTAKNTLRFFCGLSLGNSQSQSNISSRLPGEPGSGTYVGGRQLFSAFTYVLKELRDPASSIATMSLASANVATPASHFVSPPPSVFQVA
ncbi:hypothetical protein [Streptomyces tubercidicus]|uniref:hypothetical protein n=1 Tax=Streptomyces tubercidicus TaxID=47759 RepID=UPI0034658113